MYKRIDQLVAELNKEIEIIATLKGCNKKPKNTFYHGKIAAFSLCVEKLKEITDSDKSDSLSSLSQPDKYKNALISLMKAVHKHHPLADGGTEMDLHKAYWDSYEMLCHDH